MMKKYKNTQSNEANQADSHPKREKEEKIKVRKFRDTIYVSSSTFYERHREFYKTNPFLKSLSIAITIVLALLGFFLGRWVGFIVGVIGGVIVLILVPPATTKIKEIEKGGTRSKQS